MKTSNLPSKINDSGIRVLELLKYMVNNDFGINEKTCVNSKYTDIMPETYFKYFSTMESAGLTIEKKDKKYTLSNFFKKIELSEEDLQVFKIICNNFRFGCSDKEKEVFTEFFEKIIKFTEEKDKIAFLKILSDFKEQNKTSSDLQQKLSFYEKFLSSGQKLKITCSKESFICEPKKVEISNGKIYFTVYDIKTMNLKRLLVDLICDVEVLPIRATGSIITQSAVFEVYGRLIYNYRLRDNEKVETFSETSKTIVATNYDKDELLKRLLKYGENCKIIRPKFLQQEFLSMLNGIKDKIKE